MGRKVKSMRKLETKWLSMRERVENSNIAYNIFVSVLVVP